jgi:hypothetical protein
MKVNSFLIFLIISFKAFGQAPGIEWQNTIGGSNGEAIRSIQQTLDGGYILGGDSRSNISGDKTENSMGGDDYWVVKLDSLGNIQWQNTIGGIDDDLLYSIQQTLDGGYILGGTSQSYISGDKTETNLGIEDYWVVKLDTAGNIEWQNTIGGNNDEALFSIEQTSDGGYILGGTSNSPVSGDKTENSMGSYDYWIVKLDSSGNIQWQNTIGGWDVDNLYTIRQTNDGGYIAAGESRSIISGDKTENNMGDYDYWILKLDNMGSIIWQNTIGGNMRDWTASIQETFDGGYIVAGNSISNISGDKTENCFGSYDYWIVKLNSVGNIMWQNTIGGNSFEVTWSIKQTPDAGFILGGFSDSNISGDKTENSLGSYDCWVLKLDPLGNIIWQNTIGGNDADGLISIQQTLDGGYILGAYSQSNISGDKTENCLGDNDYWVIKLFPDSTTGISGISFSTNNLNIFPNPANTTLKFILNKKENISVTNLLREILIDKNYSFNPNRVVEIDISKLSAGIYFIKAGNEVRKFVKE